MSTSGNWGIGQAKISHRPDKLAVKQKRKSSMKKTIKQRFAQWLLNHADADDYDAPIGRLEQSEFDMDSPVRFDLVSAHGGRILQVRRWDRKHDSHDTTTYVIPSGEDVGQRVAKILNLELIK
jgi:hypothetical protein